MADIRIPRQTSPVPAQPVRPAVRAAQQAFFQAAAAGEAMRPAATPAQPASKPATAAAEGEPTRPLRPGSLLDIKV